MCCSDYGTTCPARWRAAWDRGRLEPTAGGQDERGATASFKGVVANGEITGDANWRGNPVKFRAYRPSARPADEPRRRKFEPTEFQRYFSGAIAPVLHIYPGDTVETWSVDAGGYDPKNVRRSLGGNPETGPFYIEGALPGDTLAIKFSRINVMTRDKLYAIAEPLRGERR